MIAGAIGGLVAMAFMWIKYGKPDPSIFWQTVLSAGLYVIITLCIRQCIFCYDHRAVAGFLVCIAVPIVEKKFKLDDPVGAISVHGVNGFWGVISLGLFVADGSYGDGLNGVAGGVRGLFGDASQLLAQGIASLSSSFGVSVSCSSSSKFLIRSGDYEYPPKMN